MIESVAFYTPDIWRIYFFLSSRFNFKSRKSNDSK